MAKIKLTEYPKFSPFEQIRNDFNQPLSALTANYQTFIKEIPTTTGYYALDQNEKIKHVIFTEKNEIAYVCSSDKSSCSLFCEAVLKQIFAKYQTTFFEADAETDWPAMTLLHLFNYDYKESFNTYIYN